MGFDNSRSYEIEISRVVNLGDLPYLEFLLDVYDGNIYRVKADLYEKYRKIGKLEDAKVVEEKLKKGVKYSLKNFDEFKKYLRKNLSHVGIEIPDKKIEIKDLEIVPVYLPSEALKIREGNIVGYQKRSALAATGEFNTFDNKTIILGNLTLAQLDDESIEDIALHEITHNYLSGLGISEEMQRKLEPLIDKSIVEFYESRGFKERAEKIKRTSGYLNRLGYIV